VNSTNTPVKQGDPTRRELLPATVAGAAALIVPRHVLGGPAFQAPSDTLRIAGVGVGGMGRRYLQACESERIVALCDVDHGFAAKVFHRYPNAKVYRDWRVLFDHENDFDAVIVATPDHSHALITLAALSRRKHVYCAKPLTHTIAEARAVAQAAERAKVATQTSVQSCAGEDACRTAELLLAGAIGPIREVHVWTDHPLYPAGQPRPGEAPPVPRDLDWDLWLGPAPERPYHPTYHPWTWRTWWDFGTGTVGDMLCHALHVFHGPLQLTAPLAVHGARTTMHGGFFRMDPDGKEYLPPRIQTPETESYSSVIAWDFAARGNHPPLRLHWYDGGMRPHRPMELDRSRPMPASGVLYVGEKGKMLTPYSGGKALLMPEREFRDFPQPPKTLRRTIGHYKEWTTGAKTGEPTNCNFSFGARMTEIALLGTLAARSARYLEWDTDRMRVPNDDEANRWISPPYRKGWTT
jgi:predicted dehydrogenase